MLYRTSVSRKRRAGSGEGCQRKACCASDGGRPSGFAVQAESPNHRKLLRSRAVVVSVAAKGPLPAGQVCDEKTSVCDTTADASKEATTASKPGTLCGPGTKARPGRVPQPGGIPARRPGGARCLGGVSSLQALAWNGRTLSPPDGNRSKWVSTAPRWREGDPQAARTARGRVPGGTGADRPVVAMKAL